MWNDFSIASLLGETTTYTYDDRNLLIGVTDFVGGKITYEYNENAQIIKKIIEGVVSIIYEYDLAVNMVTRTEIATTYTYDKIGRLISVTDPLDHIICSSLLVRVVILQ